MQLFKQSKAYYRSILLQSIITNQNMQSKATTWGISIVINNSEIRKYCAALSGINVQHRNKQNTSKNTQNKYVAVHDGRGRGQWWLVAVQ